MQVVIARNHEEFKHYLRYHIRYANEPDQLRGLEPEGLEIVFLEDWDDFRNARTRDEFCILARVLEGRGAKVKNLVYKP